MPLIKRMPHAQSFGIVTVRSRPCELWRSQLRPQHVLCFLPEPQGHGSFRPTFWAGAAKGFERVVMVGVGEAPVVEFDHPVGDLVVSGGGDGLDLLLGETGIAAGDIGEHHQAGPGLGGLDIGGGAGHPGVGLQPDGLFEALDPDFPQDLATALVDADDRIIALGLVEDRARNVVVVRHHQAHHLVGVVEALEHRPALCVGAVPDPWQPGAGRDHLRADEEAGNEAVQLLDQHRLFIEFQQRLRQLLLLARQSGHGSSSSWGRGHRRG